MEDTMPRTHDSEAATGGTTAITSATTRDLAARFVTFLETGVPPAGPEMTGLPGSAAGTGSN
jgi:hypothetical protein